MSVGYRRAGLVAAASAFVGLAACSGNTKPMDDGLKQDLAAAGPSGLELAPNSASPQLVVSADEAGPTAAPRRAAPRRVPRPTPNPARRLAANLAAPVASPAPQPVIAEPAPSVSPPAAEPAPSRRVEPPPLPPLNGSSQSRQRGTYRTEADVFRQMPWVKP